MNLWSLVRLFGDHSAVSIFQITIGIASKKFGVFSGPLIRHLCYIMLYLILPLYNLNLFLRADLIELAEISYSLVPLWFFKLIYTYGLGVLCTKLLRIPPYFEKTFIALLMADSVSAHMFFTRDELCSNSAFENSDTASTFGVNLPCDQMSKKITFYISFLNALVALGICPYLMKSDILFYKTFGKSIVWIDQEMYFAKFEVDIEKDKENYELLVGSHLLITETRVENKNFLFGHLKEAPFISVFIGIGTNALLYFSNASTQVFRSIEFVLSTSSSLHKPLVLIVLGSIIAKLSLNFSRELMADSKIAVVGRYLSKDSCLYQTCHSPGHHLPRRFAYFQIFIGRQKSRQGRSESLQVLIQYFLSSIWGPSTYLLVMAVNNEFAYREIAYIIYYDTLIGLISLPLITWLCIY